MRQAQNFAGNADCIEPDVLLDLFEQGGSHPQAPSLHRHLFQCEACSEEFRSLLTLHRMADEMRELAVQTTIATEPAKAETSEGVPFWQKLRAILAPRPNMQWAYSGAFVLALLLLSASGWFWRRSEEVQHDAEVARLNRQNSEVLRSVAEVNSQIAASRAESLKRDAAREAVVEASSKKLIALGAQLKTDSISPETLTRLSAQVNARSEEEINRVLSGASPDSTAGDVDKTWTAAYPNKWTPVYERSIVFTWAVPRPFEEYKFYCVFEGQKPPNLSKMVTTKERHLRHTLPALQDASRAFRMVWGLYARRASETEFKPLSPTVTFAFFDKEAYRNSLQKPSRK